MNRSRGILAFFNLQNGKLRITQVATTTNNIFDTQHVDLIHDAQMDYYGKKLATCSSDRSIKIFNVEGESHSLAATLQGHEGPVWQVCWAHPKFGNILASCSYDSKVFIWKDNNGWTKIKEHTGHSASGTVCLIQ